MRGSPIIAISMLLILIKYSSACIRTANAPNPVISKPGSTVTTTITRGAVMTTTTTVAPTTTTQKIPCQGCVAADINFLMADPNKPNSIDPTSEAEDNDPVTGCARLMAVCVGTPGTLAFMTFNLTGGPEENQQFLQTVKAPLMCNANDEWTYRGDVITAVGCDATPIPGAITTTTVATTTTKPCQRCVAADINFLMADPNKPKSIDATSEAEDNDPATGCARLMAVCAGTPGTVAFMTFNLNQGGPEENEQFLQTIKAPLTCNAKDEWTYRGGVVTAVDCDATPIPGAIVTTTTVATTATTQKMPNNPCQECVAADINFVKADPKKPGSIDATYELENKDPKSGCARIMAVCAGPVGTLAFMQFNLNQGGPREDPAMPQIVKAPLACNNMGKWVYLGRVITSVDCSAA